MATKSSSIQARIDPNIKVAVERILKKLGISASEAINMLYAQIILKKGLPFKVDTEEYIPNEETQRVFKETDKRKNLHKYKNEKEAFKALGI